MTCVNQIAARARHSRKRQHRRRVVDDKVMMMMMMIMMTVLQINDTVIEKVTD